MWEEWLAEESFIQDEACKTNYGNTAQGHLQLQEQEQGDNEQRQICTHVDGADMSMVYSVTHS